MTEIKSEPCSAGKGGAIALWPHEAAVNAASRSELSQPLTISREHNGDGK
jgi:hypothetical protein